MSLPTIMTTTSFDEACIPRPDPPETWIKPFLEKGSPFLGWTPMEVRDFCVSNCISKDDFEPWPLASFGILDDLTSVPENAPTYQTILLCSFMPDFNEGSEVWLKTCRVKFGFFDSELCRLETFVTRPSEIGKSLALSFAIPLITFSRQEIREQVSTGAENTQPYSDEHLAMQGSDEGCVRYLVRPAPPPEGNAEEEAGD